MSTISGVSNVLSTLNTQQLTSQRQPEGPPPQGGGGADMKAQVQTAAEQAGLNATEISQLHSELQDAMETAREEGLSQEEAIAQFDAILEENGIDVEEFKSGLDALRGGGQAPPPPPQGEQSSETEESSSSSYTAEEFIELMNSLPAGSLIDTAA